MAVLNEASLQPYRQGLQSYRDNDPVLRRLPSVPASRSVVAGRTCNERLLPRAVPGDALGRVIDCVVPTGLLVVHGRCLPDCSATFEHLVVAKRGLVVVAPTWAPGDGAGERRPAQCSRVQRRSDLVRSVLRKAGALRAWLDASAWEEVPVLAALCLPPTASGSVPPPVALDDLWVGAVERLPSWLASGGALTAAERAALSYYLISELAEPGAKG